MKQLADIGLNDSKTMILTWMTERFNQSKKFVELEALLQKDLCQTLKELLETLNVDESTT